MNTKLWLSIAAVVIFFVLIFGIIKWFGIVQNDYIKESNTVYQEVHHEETFSMLFYSKAHWFFELFVGAVEMVFVDLLVIGVIWKLWIKKAVDKRQNKAVREAIDHEHEVHGLDEHDHEH